MRSQMFSQKRIDDNINNLFTLWHRIRSFHDQRSGLTRIMAWNGLLQRRGWQNSAVQQRPFVRASDRSFPRSRVGERWYIRLCRLTLSNGRRSRGTSTASNRNECFGRRCCRRRWRLFRLQVLTTREVLFLRNFGIDFHFLASD